MIAKRIGVVEFLVTVGTRVVVERNMLSHAGSALELCIAAGAGVRHCINNSNIEYLKNY
jgi:hypothetical protein